MADMPDLRRHSPSIARNREPLRDVLIDCLAGRSGTLLEIGSGTGEHGAFIAPDLPDMTWQPSDATRADFASITGWRDALSAPVKDPLLVNCLDADWAKPFQGKVDTIFSANVIHITPPALWPSLIDGAADCLNPGGMLMFYGPFRRHGQHTAPSNANFDVWLAERDPSFAVRDWEEIVAYAAPRGFAASDPIAMPSNNFVMRLVRQD